MWNKYLGLNVQYESQYFDDVEGLLEEDYGSNPKPKTGRPVRSIMYYLKGTVKLKQASPCNLFYRIRKFNNFDTSAAPP